MQLGYYQFNIKILKLNGKQSNNLKNESLNQLCPKSDKASHRIDHLLRWVPYRFIRPFFEEETKGLKDPAVNTKIKILANEASKKEPWRCPYYFSDTGIVINEPWKEYLIMHRFILESFTYWHLCQFVQKNNPDAIGIAEKLFKQNLR